MRRDLKGIYVIWLRDIKRFGREKARILGMIGQPLLYLFVMGTGLGSTFKMAAAPGGFDYVDFIYPGIIGMTILFTALFSAVSIIWDREFGFLKEVLVAPVSRTAIVVGKTLGGSSIALIQGSILLFLAPLIGVHLTITKVTWLLFLMLIIAFAITSLGLLIASRMYSMEGFQMIMNFLVMPMFLLSGAFFPLKGVPGWMEVLMKVNPLTYGVDALRGIVLDPSPWKPTVVQFALGFDVSVVAAFTLLMLAAAIWAFNRGD